MFRQKQQPTTTLFGQPVASNADASSLFGTTIQGEATASDAFASKPIMKSGAFGSGEGGGAFNAGPPAAARTSGNNIFGAPAASIRKTTSRSSLPFWESGPTTAFGTAPTTSVDGTATTGCTLIQAFTPFLDNDPEDLSSVLCYQSIAAMPGYRHNSSEELRVQDYQRDGKINTLGPSSSTRFAAPDPSKQERLEALLRQSLLQETADVWFHLFSMRSLSSGQAMKLRALRTNKTFLAKSSRYFSDFLNTDTKPSDSSWSVITDDEDVPSNTPIDDYGYESDSDLDDCEESLLNLDGQKDQSTVFSNFFLNVSAKAQLGADNGSSENGARSVRSSTPVVTPEQPRTDVSLSVKKVGASSVSHSKAVVQKAIDDNGSTNQANMRLQSLESRHATHVLVKDTAFRTWFTLLNYLYTDKVVFLPLSSVTFSGRHISLASSLDEPCCSAKSMYRLASRVGLDYLRNEALDHIRSQLTEYNIIKELSSSLVPRHPELFEMELDLLHSLAASPSVVADFPVLVQRIVNKELVHGVDIILGIHTRFLKQLRPNLGLAPGFPALQEPVENTPTVENENEGLSKERRPEKGKKGRK